MLNISKNNGYNKDKPGEQLVTVTSTDLMTYTKFLRPEWGDLNNRPRTSIIGEYRVTVVPVNRITLQQLPNMTTYTQGQDFNPAGFLVLVEYEGGAVQEKTIDRIRITSYFPGTTRTGRASRRLP
jgi:hypothetical protein